MDENIINILKNLPKSPGVYEMLDSFQRVIYVGKSVSLKNRVSSYFLENPKWHKAKNMQPFIKDIAITRTDTDLEARYLECRKIHLLQPFYNSQMKRSRRGLYLSFENKKEPLSISYTKSEETVGPLKNFHSLKRLISDLSCLYPIHKQDGNYIFFYSPIPVRNSGIELEQTRRVLKDCFQNPDEYELFLETLRNKMRESSASFHFERAAFYRDLIQSLKNLEREVHEFSRFIRKEYFLIIQIEEGQKIFYLRHGIIEESCFLINGRYQNIQLEERIEDPKLRIKLQRVVYHFISSYEQEHLTEIK